MRSYGRSMGGLTGGLENVKSLIKNELTWKTGGLRENEECRMKNHIRHNYSVHHDGPSERNLNYMFVI